MMNQEIDPRFFELIKHLHKAGTMAHYWGVNSAGKFSYWWQVGKDEPPEMNKANLMAYDLYYSVHPCGAIPDKSIYRKSHNADIVAVNCLYAEFDDKDFAGNATGHASTFNPAPSVIVHSGGGVHAYWLLKDPFFITDKIDRESIDSVQKRWMTLYQGDVGVNDLARVLRVPGSYNHKYTPARPVEFRTFDMTLQYDLAVLEALLPPAVLCSTQATMPATPNDLDDQELLKMANKALNGAKFQRLWDGDYKRYYADDHSLADLALCTFLAFWTGRDEARMDRLFSMSGLYRQDKWGRRDYRDRTIAKACKTVYAAYAPGMDEDAVKAAMSAVGLAKGTKKAQQNTQNGAGYTTQPGPGATTPQKAKKLSDLEPHITKTMNGGYVRRENKMELGRIILEFLEDNNQIFYDTITSRSYIQDDLYRVWEMSKEKSDQHPALRAYLRTAGLNSTELVYGHIVEELIMGSQRHQTALHQNMFADDGVLYIPCGPSWYVRASLDKGLDKLPNGTDGVFFVAASVIPEWNPVALSEAVHPLALKATQIAIDAPPDAGTYTPEVQRTLLSAWLVAFIAGIRPLPLLATLGNKGGGKSMLLRAVMKVIMGQLNDLTTLTADKRDFDTMVTNDLLVGLDNVDQLQNGSEWFFDSLATTATGGMNKRRQYHTLAQQVNLPIVAAVMVSSRTASFARPDVAERTLPIFVRPFEDAERETDSSLLAELPQRRDEVLSWLAYQAINVLERRSKAPKGLPARFQDFAQVIWAYCSTQDCDDDVVPMLLAWRNAQALAVGDADPLMRAIVEYLMENSTGTGLQDLSTKDLIITLTKDGAELPFLGGGKAIAARIRELKGPLAAMNIVMTEKKILARPRFSFELKP